MTQYENYKKSHGYGSGLSYSVGSATYNATVDLNQKMDTMIQLLTRLVDIEESRAAKTGDLPKPLPKPTTTIASSSYAQKEKDTLPLGYVKKVNNNDVT